MTRPEKYITTLVTPGALSDNTVDILSSQGMNMMLLADGLRLDRDEEEMNTFYLCASGRVETKEAKKILKSAKKALRKSGIESPTVYFLPDGIKPRAI